MLLEIRNLWVCKHRAWGQLQVLVQYIYIIYIYTYIYYIQDLNFVVTAPADGLAPNGARPSAGTVMNEDWELYSSTFLWSSTILHHIYESYDLN